MHGVFFLSVCLGNKTGFLTWSRRFICALTPDSLVIRLFTRNSAYSPLMPSDSSGVRHNPNPFSFVGRRHIAGPYILPFRVIPDFGKRPEKAVKPPKAEGSDVLHDRVIRSYFANKTGVFKPQS
jgi:hypothetical protein